MDIDNFCQIGDDQFGCIKGLSTTHALVDMLHHWHLHAENMNISHVLLLGYSKAFDLVDHNILINKLQMYGVPNILLPWIGEFLSDRRQRVRIGKDISEWLHLNGSVPQGSWLGPLLYVVKLNDVHFKGLSHKYMDDSTIIEEVIDTADSIKGDDYIL